MLAAVAKVGSPRPDLRERDGARKEKGKRESE
jgi:hypothetical protein